MLAIAALSELEAQAFRYTRINICYPCVRDQSNLICFDLKSEPGPAQSNQLRLASF